VMIAQRAPGSAPAVRAVGDRLPFRDASFDAALAILTLHHWPDWRRGVAELRRVARDHVVLFTWDPEAAGFWLVHEYFPEILELDRPRFPSFPAFAEVLGPLQVEVVPIPGDCTDGFLGAYWRRPAAYLDGDVRGAISALAQVPASDARLVRLAADLADGAWARRHDALLELPELDLGYRLVIAQG
jgi:SAM-dependent methyltransferase